MVPSNEVGRDRVEVATYKNHDDRNPESLPSTGNGRVCNTINCSGQLNHSLEMPADWTSTVTPFPRSDFPLIL